MCGQHDSLLWGCVEGRSGLWTGNIIQHVLQHIVDKQSLEYRAPIHYSALSWLVRILKRKWSILANSRQ